MDDYDFDYVRRYEAGLIQHETDYRTVVKKISQFGDLPYAKPEQWVPADAMAIGGGFYRHKYAHQWLYPGIAISIRAIAIHDEKGERGERYRASFYGLLASWRRNRF